MDEQPEKTEAEHTVVMNVQQPVNDPEATDIMIRLQIISLMHQCGFDKYEAQAALSLVQAHPKYFEENT